MVELTEKELKTELQGAILNQGLSNVVSWTRFVTCMRAQGVTHLLHEIDTYEGFEMSMQMYAEVNGRCVGVYNPATEKGTVLSKPWVSWSKRDRKFTTTAI